MRKKYLEIAELIEDRLRVKDYVAGAMPGERTIAADLGVSYMTARRAVQHLAQTGVLPARIAESQPTRSNRKQLSIAYLAPAFASAAGDAWHASLHRAVSAKKGTVKAVGYRDWSDRAITATLNGEFDGIFMIPPAVQTLPGILADQLQRAKHRLVTLFADYTQLGIPCVDMGAPRFIPRLAEHLASLGHRHVGCINTQPMTPVIEQRLAAWQAAAAKYGLEGPVHNEPVAPFEDAALRAYELAARLMDEGKFTCTAYFCALTLSAIGVIRAAYERDIRIGQDVSLCSCDSAEASRLLTPSLTTLQDADRTALCSRGLEWIMTGGKNWKGPLSILPDDLRLVIGESTGPCSGRKPRAMSRNRGVAVLNT